MYVRFPQLAIPDQYTAEHLDLLKHFAATIAAGVRDVDEVGRPEENAFAVVLANLEAGSLSIVSKRVSGLLKRMLASTPEAGGEFRIGGVEVLTASHTYGTVLDTAQRLSDQAEPNGTNLSTI